MKYKVTTRGWIVFSILGLILVLTLFNLGSKLLKDDISTVDGENELEAVDVVDIEDSLDDAVSDNDEPTVTADETTGDDATDEDATNEDATDEDATNEDATDEDATDEDATNEDSVVDEEAKLDFDKRQEILFSKNISELNEIYFIVLDEWVELLLSHEDVSITIEGHINGYPYYDDGEYGLAISQNRAVVVSEYLIDNGVDPSRIHLLNLGSKEQVNASDDMSQHYLNRRAILYINKK